MTAYDLDTDVGIEHCPCGRLTSNQWGLCNRCTEDEWNDRDWNRGSSLVDGSPLG